MPIYEFFCKKCNTIYKFFSRTIDTTTIPKCPKCKRIRLERVFSSFATLSKKDKEGSPVADIDESRLEKAIDMLEKESGSINEDDPRKAADLMRKLTDAAGISMGEGMEEALSRLERGEDPDSIEEDMSDLLDDESFSFESKKKKGAKKAQTKLKVDETLYEL